MSSLMHKAAPSGLNKALFSGSKVHYKMHMNPKKLHRLSEVANLYLTNLIEEEYDIEVDMPCSPIQPDTCPEISKGGACVGYTLKARGKLIDKEAWDMNVGDTFWDCADKEQIEFLESRSGDRFNKQFT